VTRRQEIQRDAVDHRRCHERVPQVLVRRGRGHEISRDWDAYYEAGKKLKAKGHPLGQAVSHSFGDPRPSSIRCCGHMAARKWKPTARRWRSTARTRSTGQFMTAFYKDTCDEGGLAWDDTSNNRAFLSQTISSTLNGASIYIESLRFPEKYTTEKGLPLKSDILHAPLPKGPAGQFGLHTSSRHADELLEEPEGGERAAEVGAHAGKLREVVHLTEGSPHRRRRSGKPQTVER